jgi:transposase
MSIIRQGSLFDLQDLYDLEPTHRYEAILSSVDVDSIVYQVSKKSWRGAPVELNYRAMIHSLIIRVFDRIPTIKVISDQTPSEAAYSRLISKLETSQVLEEINEKVVLQAFSEGFIMDEAIALMLLTLRLVIKLHLRVITLKKNLRKSVVENQSLKENNG